MTHRQLTQEGFPLSEELSSAKHAAWRRGRCRHHIMNNARGRVTDPTTEIIRAVDI